MQFCPPLLSSPHLQCTREAGRATATGPNATGHSWWSGTAHGNRDVGATGVAALPPDGPPLQTCDAARPVSMGSLSLAVSVGLKQKATGRSRGLRREEGADRCCGGSLI